MPRRPSAPPSVAAARRLRAAVGRLAFAPPVAHVYNPLEYAWPSHAAYLERYASGPKRVLFLGMNPGPFGMMQTGVPFGEIAAVRDWMGIEADIAPPARQHPSRPIEGFACRRSEVSGRRLWGFFAERFRTPERFFQAHAVANYCPLAFLEETGRNRTPDKLSAAERDALFQHCDRHLKAIAKALAPEWIIGIGGFAETRAREALGETGPRIGRVLHPSPANPAANRDWPGAVERQLRALGVWRDGE